MSDARAVIRGLCALSVLTLCSALLASVTAPVVQAGLRAAGVVDPSYAEVVFRSWQVSAMLLTGVALAVLGAPLRASWGLAVAPGAARRAAHAFAQGGLALGLVAGLILVLGVRTVRHDLDSGVAFWAYVVVSALASAAVIAVLEELWFRGGLFSLLGRCGNVSAAVWLSSTGYALAHFIDTDTPPVSSLEDWRVAARLLAASGNELLVAENLDSLLALLAAGWWLSTLRRRDSDIVAAIALHMSLVVVIKVFKKLTYIDPDAPLRWLAGRYDDLIGWLAFVVLVGFALPAWRRVGVQREALP